MSGEPTTDPTREAIVEVLDVLLSRRDVVESLLETPKDKRELVAELGVSRSTVDRAIRELETTGLIEHVGGEFSVSPMGRMAASELTDLVETVELGHRLEAFLEWVPMDEFDIDPRLLADAEVVLAEPGDPYAMINRHVRLIEQMKRSKVLLPFTGLHAAETAGKRVVDHDAEVEMVVEPEIADLYQSSPEYAEIVTEMAATGRLEVFAYDGTIPYAINLINDTLQLIVAEGDQPRALLETDSPEVCEWAERTYREYKDDAEQVLP